MVAGPADASPTSGPPELPKPDSHGLTLVEWEQVDPTQPASVPRLIDATFTSEAIYAPGDSGETPVIDELSIPVKVRILLPANYRTGRAHRYPVLYLLHGGGGSYTNWSDDGDIVNVVAESSFDGIVVRPEGGWAGWYTNWAGETDGHFSPQWETFHIRQLLPWIDSNFNTIRGTTLTEPAGQTIVAGSMGTIGASVGPIGPGGPDFLVSGDTDARIRTVFGNPGRSGQWDRENPVRLARKYNRYDGKMALYSGSGTDAFIGVMNADFHEVLADKGVEHSYCTGPGEHRWIWWKPDLADFLEYVYGDTPATCPNDWGDPIERVKLP